MNSSWRAADEDPKSRSYELIHATPSQVEASAEANCTLSSIILRSDMGFPIQVEKTGDNAYKDPTDARQGVSRAWVCTPRSRDSATSGPPSRVVWPFSHSRFRKFSVESLGGS